MARISSSLSQCYTRDTREFYPLEVESADETASVAARPYHGPGVQHEEVRRLRDVGGVDQVVVGVLVLAVAVLQSLHKLHQRRHRNLKRTHTNTRLQSLGGAQADAPR